MYGATMISKDSPKSEGVKSFSKVLQTIQRTTKCERRQLGRSVAHACQVLMDLKCQESILECAGK